MSSRHMFMSTSFANEAASVATLSSLGSASWVAAHFARDDLFPKHSDAATSPYQEEEAAAAATPEQSRARHACEECTRSFDSTGRLQAHMERVHSGNERGFKCPHCGKGFTRRSEMGRHVGVSQVNCSHSISIHLHTCNDSLLTIDSYVIHYCIVSFIEPT